MTRAEYARHRGVTKVAVAYAIRDGRISTTTDARGRVHIDSDLADKQWYFNTAHEKKQGTPEGNQPKPLAAHEAPPRETPSDEPLMNDRDAKAQSTAGSYSTNRAIKEHFNARLAKLDFEEKSGRMVDSQDVQNEAFKIARAVRDAMLSIPDRISAELAAETDTFKVHKKLADEIRKALVSLKDS